MKKAPGLKTPWQLDLETRYTAAEAQAIADTQIATHTTDDDAHQDLVTLAASADELLGITAQVLSLDSKAVGLILAGPLSGAAAAPTLKALSHVAVSDGFGKMLFNAADGLLLLGPGCPRTPTTWDTLQAQRTTLTGTYHEVPGRWPESRALMIEGTATTLTTNPSFEINTDRFNAQGAGTTITRITTDARRGVACLEVVTADVTTAGVRGHGTVYLPATEGLAYTFSLDARLVTASPVKMEIVWRTAAGAAIATVSQNITLTSAWQRFSLTATAPATTVYASIYMTRTAAGIHTYRIDGVNFVAALFASTYIDGDQGPGYTWTGTAHASTSIRAATTVNLAAHAGLLSDRNTVSIAVWMQAQYNANDPNWPSGAGTAYIMDYRGADDNNRAILRFVPANNTFAVYLNGADRLTSAAQTFKAGDWIRAVVTLNYTADLYTLSINGVLAASATTALTAPTALAYWTLGQSYVTANFGGWAFDEVAAWGRVLTAEEWAADFARGQPLTNTGALAPPVVNGYGIRLPVSYADVSNPPTDAELTAAFGWQADGFTALLDDAGAATKTWKVGRASAAWWYEELTKAT